MISGRKEQAKGPKPYIVDDEIKYHVLLSSTRQFHPLFFRTNLLHGLWNL